MNLVLASTSPYRARNLQQLRLPFTTLAPGIDEMPRDGENIHDYVARLAREKAEAVAARAPGSLVIGSDQACTLQGLILGKPGTPEQAEKQLRLCRGNWVDFHTGLALLNADSGACRVHVEPFRVRFRNLADEEIAAYVRLDQPLDCAGSFKVEAAGIALFEAMEGRDYNSLLGLPMIALVDLLREAGINPLLAAES